jgi:hypothetical protein
MTKQKRKLVENLLLEIYEKGLQQSDCNLTDYYKKILQALNMPVINSAKPKCKINVDDPNAPWNWKKGSDEN